MKLVLAASPARDSPEALCLGAASVAAAVKAAGAVWPELAGCETSIVEAAPDEGAAQLASRIAAAGPGVVGLSVYSWNREAFASVARYLRSAVPGLIVFAGGPEVTADPQSFALEAGLDFAIAGRARAPP